MTEFTVEIISAEFLRRGFTSWYPFLSRKYLLYRIKLGNMVVKLLHLFGLRKKKSLIVPFCEFGHNLTQENYFFYYIPFLHSFKKIKNLSLLKEQIIELL